MSSVRRKLVWWVLVPLVVVAVLIVSIPYILRSIDYRALLVWQLETQLKRKVELGNASVEIFPHVRIALEGLHIRERDGVATFVSADRLFVDLRIFPLLARKVLVKRVLLDRPTVAISRGSDGTLNIADLFTAAQGGVTIPMLGEEITITDGRISFTDHFQAEPSRSLTIHHLNTRMKSQPSEVTVKVSAGIPYDNGEATAVLTAKVPRQPGKEGALGDRGEGRLDAQGLNLAQLAPFLQSRSLLEGFHGIVDVSTGFEYRAGKDEDSLTLKDLRGNVAGTVITGSAIIKGVLTRPAGFVVSLTTTQFRLESLIASASEDVLDSHGLGFLKSTRIEGPVKVVSLRVMGNQDLQVTVQGEVELLGAQAVIGADKVPLSDVRGLLRIDGDHAGIERLTGKYGQAEVSAGRGEISNLTADPELYLALKGKVSAAELVTIIARFAPPVILPQGAGLRDLSGEADTTVLLAGSLTHLDTLRVEWVLDARDLAFTDPRLHVPVSHLRGKVRSIPRGVVFEQVSGAMGKSAVVLDGEIRYPVNEPTRYGFQVTGRSEPSELWSFFAGGPPENLNVAGTTDFKASLSGPADLFRITGTLDLTQTGMTNTAGWGKVAGVPGDVEFALQVVPKRVRLDRVFFQLPPLNVLVKGDVSFEGARQFALTMRMPAVAFRALPKSLLGSTVTLTSGSVQADLSADGTLDNWRMAALRGRISIKNTAFKMDRLEHPIEDLNLDVAFLDNRIDIEHASVKVEDSQMTAKAKVKGWRGVPVVEVVLDSPGMDLDLLIPKGERSPIRTALEALTSSAKLSGIATIQNGTYKGIDIDEISAKLSGGDSKLIVDSISGRLPVGRITGQLTIDLIPDKPLGLQTSLMLDKVPVEQLFQVFGVKTATVTGALSLKGNLRGQSGTYSTLDGEVTLIVSKGYFQKLSAASKIIGLLNLPTLLAGKVDFSNRGMPFDCLNAHLVVKNGLAKIEHYVVDSPIMKITAAGAYDIPSNSTNVVMAVSPLGSYEEFLKSIPVFGKLFVGDRQELVTAFYDVKGPLEDPRVTLLPIRSVTSGMGAFAELSLDLMKNVFLLPKELLSPSKIPPSPCATF